MTQQTSQLTPQEKLKEIEEFWTPAFNLKLDYGDDRTQDDLKWLIVRIRQLEKALEFYAQPWGEYQGSPIKSVNKFTQNRLNETRIYAMEALQLDPIDVNANAEGEK